MPVQVHPVPFQTRYLGRTAACCQGKPYQGRQVRRAVANQYIRLRTVQPAIPLDFTSQESNFRKLIDPLPFVAGHPKKAPHRRQVPIYCRGFVSFLEFTLDHGPNHITVDLVKHHGPQVRIKKAANPLHIRKTSQRPFQFEIPDNSFLPATLRLDTKMGFPVRV